MVARRRPPPLGRRGSKGVISQSLYPIVDSEQELPPVQLEVDLLRLGALVSDVRRIEHVVDLEQQRQSLQAVAELVARLKIGDLVTMDVLERAVVREVRHLADVLGARARGNARREARILVVEGRAPYGLGQSRQRNGAEIVAGDDVGAAGILDGDVAVGLRKTQDRAEVAQRI